MEPFRYHVYVCTQEKPDGAPCCAARGGQGVARRAAGGARQGRPRRRGAGDDLGLARDVRAPAPNMVVYPDGVWYSGVQVGDLPEIIREHFLAGRPVMRLVNADPVALKAEILENKRKAIAAMKARGRGTAGEVKDRARVRSLIPVPRPRAVSARRIAGRVPMRYFAVESTFRQPVRWRRRSCSG